MARTEVEIQELLKDSINTTDPSLDTTQGPIPDIMIRPQAGQLALSSEEAESLRTLFTLQFPTAITEEEARLALANYGSSPGVGTKSQHTQYFLRFTRPTEDVIVPTGTLVSNGDGSLTYRVVSGGTMAVSGIDSFYNSTRNAYELGLLVEATGTGTEYELPRFRVNTILTPVPGIDATENRTKSSGGSSQESLDSQANRLRSSLLGVNLGSPGGLKTQILNMLNSEVTDVSTIQPFHPGFFRLTDRAALDVYVVGSSSSLYTQTAIATAGQTQFVLDKKPALEVNSVLINGVSGMVEFTLVNDSSNESRLSLNAQDVVVISPAAMAGDTVVIEYTYNKVPEDVYNTVYDNSNEYFFNTDILVRSPIPVNPVISGEIRVLPSYPVTEIEAAIEDFNANFFNFTTFKGSVLPEEYRQTLLTSVSGIQTFRLTEFRRKLGALSDLEPILYEDYEISVLNNDYITLKTIK